MRAKRRRREDTTTQQQPIGSKLRKRLTAQRLPLAALCRCGRNAMLPLPPRRTLENVSRSRIEHERIALERSVPVPPPELERARTTERYTDQCSEHRSIAVPADARTWWIARDQALRQALSFGVVLECATERIARERTEYRRGIDRSADLSSCIPAIGLRSNA